jgi:DNA-binding MltR family transcriptional regulator
MATRMLQRRGTATQWANANPTLGSGEIGFETDTGQFKIGDNSTAWDDLPYFKNIEDLGGNLDDYILLEQKGAANGVATLDGSNLVPTAQIPNTIARVLDVNYLVANAVYDLTNTAPELLNTLGEISNAINNDADFYLTLQNNISNAQDEAYEYVDNNINTLSNNINDIANSLQEGLDNAIVALEDYTDCAIANVVLYLDNADLSFANAANDYADDVVGNAVIDLQQELGNAVTDLEQYTDNAISDHNLEITNVHGISNTATLVTLTDLSNHESDTSNVHGILNTLAVVLTDDARLSDARTPLDNSVTNNSISGTINQDKITNLVTTLGNLASLSGADFTGNVTIDQDLTVDGNFIVNGSNVVVSATQLQIEDTMLQLGHTNANNVTDLGLVVSYNDGTQKHAGIVKDVTDGKWKLFDGVTTEPATTVNFGQGSLDVLALLTLEANSITATSDITANGIVFADGTQRLEGVPSRTPIIQKTASYTLSALTERDDLIEMDNASATTLTIPLNSAVAFPIGTSIDILQTGVGQVTIAGDAGVTVNATPGLKLRTRWSSCTLFKRATNTWVVYGDLTA